ncbi:Tryptophan synthase alpha chain [termite gut metagenome]|uniref:tryptophan synthase n=1 Tax=termite gut metagenome TaxID=433724 RepID=A0A5J4Q0M1_9ZZZZ
MNRINQLFNNDKKNLLSVYFLAGHPALDSTVDIIQALEKNGVDMVQIGIPSKAVTTDTAILQEAAACALKNGMTLKLLFEQMRHIRRTVNVPLLLSGSIDTITDFGIESFCRKCVECDLDGIVIPDLLFDDYQKRFRIIADRYGLLIIMYITPEIQMEKLEQIDKHSSGFIYVSIPTSEGDEQKNTIHYKRDFFKKIKDMKLNNSLMVSLDINSKANLQLINEYVAAGAIIESHFVELLHEEKDAEQAIKKLLLRLKK